MHDQEMSRAVIVSFHWLYGTWHRLVETIHWSHQYHRISAERTVLSCHDIEHHLTVAAWPASFSKKYGPTMLPAQNPHQTVIRCGCICFSLITRGFSETRQFCRLMKPSRWKCASSLRIISLEKAASTFSRLIIHSTLLYRITLHFYQP